MEENKSLKYAKEIDEICKTFENEKEEEKCKSNFRELYEKTYKALPTSKWDEFKEYCYKDERFRDGYAKSYGEERFNERFIKVFGRIASKEYVKEIEEICNAYEKATNDDLRVIAFKNTYSKIYKSLHYSKWDEFKKYCYENELFRKYYKKSFGEDEFNKKYVKEFGRITSENYKDEINEICKAFDNGTDEEDCKEKFKNIYETIFYSILENKRREFKEYCYKDERFKERYIKSYSEERFTKNFINEFTKNEVNKQSKQEENESKKDSLKGNNSEDTDEFDFDDSQWYEDEDVDENKVTTFKEFAQSKNMSQEDLTAVLQRYGYFTNEGQPLKKWIDAGLFDKEKQFYINTKAGKELFEKIIDKRHRYENYQIKQFLIEKGFSEDEISFDKTLIILNGIKYKCFTSSDLKEIDKTQFDNIEQIYLNLNLCRLSGQIKNNEVEEQEKLDEADNNDDDFNFCESDDEEDETKSIEEENLKKQKDEQLDKKIKDYKNECNKKFLEDRKIYGLNTDLLIDKITESIRNHSSSDLKEYLRNYSTNLSGPELTTICEKTAAASCCATEIVEILEDLRSIFEDDEIALKHIDKCYRSIKQLAYEKKILAEKLIQETLAKEKETQSDSEEDYDDYKSDMDDNDDDDIFDIDDDQGKKQSNIEEQISRKRTAILEHFDNETYSNIDVEYYVDYVIQLLSENDTDGINNLFETLLMESTPGKDSESLLNAGKGPKAFNVISVTILEIGDILNSKTINSYINRDLQKQKNIFEKLVNSINLAYNDYFKRQKTKQNLKKVGRFLGTVALSPLIATAKVAQWSDEYSQRPDVQERRRIASIEYYCKFCGQPFKRREDAAYHPCHVKIAYDKALAKLEGGTPPAHHYCQIYEGGQKSEYVCKYCGKKARTISELVFYGPCNVRHIQNIDKYGTHGGTAETAAISKHEPAL